jgi:hypothetical protein
MHTNNWTTQESKKWLSLSASSFTKLETVMQAIAPTVHTQVRRHAERSVYDLGQIHSILDQGYICHLDFVVDGQPFVIPTANGRSSDQIYVHGSTTSRTLCSLAAGINVCATVTLVDGLVLARSACRHSINYRSVVIFGKERLVMDPRDKVVPPRAQLEGPVADPHVLHGIPVVDRGRFDRAHGFASRPTMLTDVLLPYLPVDGSQRNRGVQTCRLMLHSQTRSRADGLL